MVSYQHYPFLLLEKFGKKPFLVTTDGAGTSPLVNTAVTDIMILQLKKPEDLNVFGVAEKHVTGVTPV